MKKPLLYFFAGSLLLLSTSTVFAADDDRDALEIGKAVIAVDKALEYELPENPTPADVAKSQSLTKAAVEAGQLTRLYPWVSARIAQEIGLAQGRLKDTPPDEKQARKLSRRIEYLQHLKLLIDAPL